MAYLLRNIFTKNCWNSTTIVEIVVGGWVDTFFATQCITENTFFKKLKQKALIREDPI